MNYSKQRRIRGWDSGERSRLGSGVVVRLCRAAALTMIISLAGICMAEARTYMVSPSGNDQADGSPQAPFRTISRAAGLANGGDTVLVTTGSYSERIVVANAGTPSGPITFVASPPGDVELSGDAGFQPAQWAGDDDDATTSGGGWVTVRGFTFRQIKSSAVIRASRGWRIEDCLFQDTEFGVNIRGHDVVVQDTTFEDLNGPNAHAVVAVGGHNIVLQSVTIRRVNSQRQIEAIPNSAVTKFSKTEGLRIEHLLSEENVGPGLWLDWDNRNFTIRDSVIRYNKGDRAMWEGAGLWLEANGNAHGTVVDNQIYGNAGPGIAVMESSQIEIRDNRLENNNECIELRNMKRDETGDRTLRDLNIRNNLCSGWVQAGVATSIGEWSGWSLTAMDIGFHDNLYEEKGKAPVFDWLGHAYLSVDEAREGLGAELTSISNLDRQPDTARRQ